MFTVFGEGGDGAMAVGEFKSVFDSFNFNFTIDEVRGGNQLLVFRLKSRITGLTDFEFLNCSQVCELVHELDEHDEGILGEKEFTAFLEKHNFIFQTCNLHKIRSKRCSVSSSLPRHLYFSLVGLVDL